MIYTLSVPNSENLPSTVLFDGRDSCPFDQQKRPLSLRIQEAIVTRSPFYLALVVDTHNKCYVAKGDILMQYICKKRLFSRPFGDHGITTKKIYIYQLLNNVFEHIYRIDSQDMVDQLNVVAIFSDPNISDSEKEHIVCGIAIDLCFRQVNTAVDRDAAFHYALAVVTRYPTSLTALMIIAEVWRIGGMAIPQSLLLSLDVYAFLHERATYFPLKQYIYSLMISIHSLLLAAQFKNFALQAIERIGAEQQEALKQAYANFSYSFQYNPQDPVVMTHLAAFFLRGNHGSPKNEGVAYELLNRAYLIQPNNVTTLNFLAEIHQYGLAEQRVDRKKAGDLYQQALHLSGGAGPLASHLRQSILRLSSSSSSESYSLSGRLYEDLTVEEESSTQT